MRPLLVCLLTAVAAFGDPGPPTVVTLRERGKPATLSKADRDFLDCLISEFLFDPKGAVRVCIHAGAIRPTRPFSWGGDTREGWLVGGRGREPDRVYFADGESTPAPPPERTEQIDFFAACRQRYQRVKRPSNDDIYTQLLIARFNPQEDSDLTLAAWLHRLGHDELAAQALLAARNWSGNDPRDRLRRDLAERAFELMQEAFRLRADSEALAHGERLFRLYPDIAADRHPHAEAILNDLRRRLAAGTIDRKRSTELPTDFGTWNMSRRITFLIDGLDEVDQQRDNYFRPAWVDDKRVVALVRCGDAAIPALLDALERDKRLTRLPEQQRGGCILGPTGRNIGVHDVLESVIIAILRVRDFDPTAASPDPQVPEARAAQIRTYWETYGRLPFDERMMRILTDRGSTPFARREAAANLASLSRDNGPYRWDRVTGRDTCPARLPNPVVEKFRQPTAAEAILASLEREREDRARWPDRLARNWEGVEERYLDNLVQLGDARIAGELTRLAVATPDVARRRRLALAAHRFGASAAWLALVRNVERGTVSLVRTSEQPGDEVREPARELAELVSDLTETDLPDADRALQALARPDHPWYPLVAAAVLDTGTVLNRYSAWGRHPFCLTVLRQSLDDTRLTGRHFYLRGDEIEHTPLLERQDVRLRFLLEEINGRRDRPSGLPADHPDPKDWLEHAEERVCDVAAQRLTQFLAGIEPYHPLHRDADKSLERLKSYLDLRRGQFRRLSDLEAARLALTGPDPLYIADIRPLGRPATAADVAAGRAIFHLDGKGKLAELKSPAWLILKADATQPVASGNAAMDYVIRASLLTGADQQLPAGLIVQAESGPDGTNMFGVIFRNSTRTIRADEVERIEPYKK